MATSARDVEPSNVMLIAASSQSSAERVKLLDFGIAKLSENLVGSAYRTRTGMMLGTPTYMSPEQCRGSSQVDGQSDVYSLGVVFYHMLAGAAPFRADSDLVLMNLHALAEAPAVQKLVPTVSAATAALLGRMLAKDKAARPTMAAVARATAPGGAAESAKTPPTVLFAAADPTALLSTELQSLEPTAPQRTVPRRAGVARRPLVLALAAVGIILLGLAIGLQGSRRAGRPLITPPPALPQHSAAGSPERAPTADPSKDSASPPRPKTESVPVPKASRRKSGDRSQPVPSVRINARDIID